MIAGGIDEGVLLKQVRIALDPKETAFSLNWKCFEAAASAFSSLLVDWEQGFVHPVPQDLLHKT